MEGRKEKGVMVEERECNKGKKKEEEEEEEELKWKAGMILQVGKRGGPSTPSPTWRLEFSSSDNNNSNNPVQEFLNTNSVAAVSARKLCANLWEIQPQPHLPLSSRRPRRRGHRKDKKSVPFLGPSTTPPHQLENERTLRSQMKPYQSVNRNLRGLQPLSPASEGSSMEVASYNCVFTPTSSLNVDGRMGESSYSIKTSTQLLKVLNRIWSLEEQQTSNISLLKALKMELDHSQSQIKKLLKEKGKNRQGMDDLMKQVVEDKIVRKDKEQERIKAAMGSVKEELGDERKLRKHSESLRLKLARELSEVKSSFSSALKELERERKARMLLENLCDEFAKGIREYEQEVRSIRLKFEVDHVNREQPDRLVLHIAEAWLDERMQMKLAEARNDPAEKNTIVDKLGFDIETFLQARHSVRLTRDSSSSATKVRHTYPRRESFPLNEAASAPRDGVDEEDSIDGDFGCFVLNKSSSGKQITGGSRRQCHNASKSLMRHDVINYRMRNHSLSSEGDKIYPEENLEDASCIDQMFAGQTSPVQKWKPKLASPEFEKTREVKENTLEAKLIEARLEGQKSRSKASKASPSA